MAVEEDPALGSYLRRRGGGQTNGCAMGVGLRETVAGGDGARGAGGGGGGGMDRKGELIHDHKPDRTPSRGVSSTPSSSSSSSLARLRLAAIGGADNEVCAAEGGRVENADADKLRIRLADTDSESAASPSSRGLFRDAGLGNGEYLIPLLSIFIILEEGAGEGRGREGPGVA